MGDSTISKSVTTCLRLFKRLTALEPQTFDVSERSALAAFEEEHVRCRVWAGNIGAHKSGRSSLQYRLRDASHLQEQVVSLFDDLAALLEDAVAIVSGDKIPWDRLEDDGDDDSDGFLFDDGDSKQEKRDNDFPETELGQITTDVADVINCLLRLSVAIRNPAPHDRFKASIPVDTSHFEAFDIQYVRDKFREVDDSLAERLGKAISRRRQYFKYRESHHNKLVAGLETETQTQREAESTIASSIPDRMKTTSFNPTLSAMDEDALSDSGVSQTSFASSNADDTKLKVPPLPKEADKGPFECPFCFMMITATSTISWRRHVFGDLRPYVCLSSECEEAGKEFSRRHEWTAHELQNHWKTYHCPYGCGKTFPSTAKCRDHSIGCHPDSTSGGQLDALIRLGARPRSSVQDIACPLCEEPLSSFKQYQRHVGRHQEQLALFALPSLTSRENETDDEHNSNSSDVDVDSKAQDQSNEGREGSVAAESDHQPSFPDPVAESVVARGPNSAFEAPRELSDDINLRNDVPEEEMYLLELCMKHQDKKGTAMWDSMAVDFAERFGRKPEKAALQQMFIRAKQKWVIWPPKDTPGSYDDFLSFTPTPSASLEADEFDASIVIEDAEYRRRDSPPGSNIGRGAIPGPGREGENQPRQGQGIFDDAFTAASSQAIFTSADTRPSLTRATPFAGKQTSGEGSGAQVRQMVMPHRMRWVYLDPQGQVQGPFTGLEMNDWYKANLFAPDLRVKKIEDPDFESLGQLIRRIGNSREPFLVPQIGIRHGRPPQTRPFSPSSTTGVIPPLSGVFPSYGRTLTTEEQNNLERRKQEEQFIMAQQREFMLRQQALSNDELGPGTTSKSSPVLDREPVADERGSMFRGERKKKKKSRRKQAEELPLLPQASFADVASTSYTSYTAPFGDTELMKREPNVSSIEFGSATSSVPRNASTVQASGGLANPGYVQPHHLRSSQQDQYVKKPSLFGNQQNISRSQSTQGFGRWRPLAPSAAKPVLTDSQQTSAGPIPSTPRDKAASSLEQFRNYKPSVKPLRSEYEEPYPSLDKMRYGSWIPSEGGRSEGGKDVDGDAGGMIDLGGALGPTSYDRYDRIRSGGVAADPQNSSHTTTKSPGRDQGSRQRGHRSQWDGIERGKEYSPGSEEDLTKARTLVHGPEEQIPRHKATDEVFESFWDFIDTSPAEKERKYRLPLSDGLGKSGPSKQQATDDAMEERPTHTRMARRHVSLETLRTFDMEHTIDEEDAGYVIVKRWVPEWVQADLWEHTKRLREKRLQSGSSAGEAMPSRSFPTKKGGKKMTKTETNWLFPSKQGGGEVKAKSNHGSVISKESHGEAGSS